MKFEILFTKSQMYKYLFYNFTSITKIYAIQYNAIHYITIKENTIQYNIIHTTKQKA